MPTKQCSKCRQIKDLELFFRRSDTSDGRRADCKVCKSKADREYEKRPEVREKQRKQHKAFFERHKEKIMQKYRQGMYKQIVLRSRAAWIERNPEAHSAHNSVRNAVVRGRLARISTRRCAHCGGQAHHYHHHNGYGPEHRLDVIPLCRKCHRDTKDQ